MRIFLAAVFANTNLPEKRYRVCISEKKIKKWSAAIFKTNISDRYKDRPTGYIWSWAIFGCGSNDNQSVELIDSEI